MGQYEHHVGHGEDPPMYEHSCPKVVICLGHRQVRHFDGSTTVMATAFGAGWLPQPAASESGRNALGAVSRGLPARMTEGAGKSTFCEFTADSPSKPVRDWSCKLSVRIKALPMHRKAEKLDRLARPVRFARREPPSILRDCKESWENTVGWPYRALFSEMSRSPATLVRFGRNGAGDNEPLVFTRIARLPAIWVKEFRPSCSK